MRRLELRPPYNNQPYLLQALIKEVNSNYCTEIYYDEFGDLITTLYQSQNHLSEEDKSKKRLLIHPQTLEIIER